MEVIDYQSIRKQIKASGKSKQVEEYAKVLQRQLSEGEYILSEDDALVMAYTEFIETRSSYY